jgi:propionyl-CoA carboxylase alpha chain
MIDSLLIANRVEIARRIIRTARRLGVRTVAVYSEADAGAPHVIEADEALWIGPAPARESYLNADAILDAAQRSGAQAIHPGYGFLSENADFAEAVLGTGRVWVGPPPGAIRAMGLKDAAKRLMADAGVPVTPGYLGDDQAPTALAREAAAIGWPVLIKAVAGGGGKGMRRVDRADEFHAALEGARREAASAFGDDRVLLERFVTRPRHLEVQVFGDTQGRVVHLFERDCSLQRRHQKVIEEAPAPGLDAATREALCAAAVRAAQAVGYVGAGTIEFIADASEGLRADRIWFMEMNTRLQVEHPVTEAITGLDLVEWQLRVASGEPLPLRQDEIAMSGHAIEARLYAEDPTKGFRPSTGPLTHFVLPAGLRVDSGVERGGEITPFYDPMIAKLIAHGGTRDQAIAHLRDALNEFYIRGVSHNISFLAALLEHSRFRQGRLSTSMIADEYPHGFHPADAVHDDPALLITVAAAIHRRYMDLAAGISGQLPGYERRAQNEWVVAIGGVQNPVVVQPIDGGHDVTYGGESYRVLSDWQFGQPLFKGTVNSTRVCLQVERRNMTYRLFHWGSQVDVMVLTARAAELLATMPEKKPPDTSRFVLSPMPGLLSQLMVNAGDEVKPGQHLAVVEAMKMENVLGAERDGRIRRTLATVGDTLAVDQPILEFE